jgi:hypothetical protein
VKAEKALNNYSTTAAPVVWRLANSFGKDTVKVSAFFVAQQLSSKLYNG